MFSIRVPDTCRVAVFVLVITVLGPRLSWCQVSSVFEEMSMRLGPDDRILVTVGNEHPVKGTVVSLSDTALRVATEGTVREFRAAEIERIDRVRRDGLKNGILWGLVAGLGVGFLGLPLAGDIIKLDDADTAIIVGLYAIPAAGAVVGAAIDASITTAVPVYVRRRVSLTLSTAPGDRAVTIGARLAF